MYNYYYISLPNISELKQKVLVLVGEEEACEPSMLDPEDAHSLDTVPGSARYSTLGRLITQSSLRETQSRAGLGQKPPKRWEQPKAAAPGRNRATVQHER